MKTVILAAGMGSRLKSLTKKIPKPFLNIDGKPLIIRSLDNLDNIGIKEVIIVVGYLEDLIKNNIGNYYKNITITYISNPDYSNTGSMYSFSQTEGIIDDEILLIEGDLLYEKKALISLINSTESNEILVAPLSGSGDEVYICVNESNELINLGKDIENKYDSIGELVGITKLSLHFLSHLYKKAKEDYNREEKLYHYEEVILKLSKTYPIKCKLISDLNWIEIDTKKDLSRAIEIVYPKIKINEN